MVTVSLSIFNGAIYSINTHFSSSYIAFLQNVFPQEAEEDFLFLLKLLMNKRSYAFTGVLGVRESEDSVSISGVLG